MSTSINMNFIAKYLNNRKLNKLRSRIAKKHEEAVQFQRNGKLREYADSLKEANALEDEYLALKEQNEN